MNQVPLSLIWIEETKDRSLINLTVVTDMCLLTPKQGSDYTIYTEIKSVTHLECGPKPTTNSHQ